MILIFATKKLFYSERVTQHHDVGFQDPLRDIKKTFYIVDHGIVFDKLYAHEIRHNDVINWLSVSII